MRKLCYSDYMTSLFVLRSRSAALLLGLCTVILTASSCHEQAVVTPPVTVTPVTKHSAPTLLPIAFPAMDTGQISSVVFSPDGRRLAFGYGTDAEVTVWNLETGRLSWQRHVDGAGGGPLLVDPRGRFLVVEMRDPDASEPIWVTRFNGQLIQKLSHYIYGGQAKLDKSGRFLVTSGDRETTGKHSLIPLTEVWDTRTWRRVDHLSIKSNVLPLLTAEGRIIRERSHALKSQLLTDDGQPVGAWWKRFKTTYSDEYDALRDHCFVRASGNHRNKGQIEVWDLSLKTRLWKSTMAGDAPRAGAISPDGRVLAIGTIGGSVEFRELKTGKLLARTHCSDDVIRCLTFSPNGHVLAAAGGGYYRVGQTANGVRLLDCTTHKLIAAMKAAFPDTISPKKDWTLDHPDWFVSLPDLSYLASESVKRKIRMPGKPRDAAFIQSYERSERIRATLRYCYSSKAAFST
jgi:WD40 repeat protein